MRILLVRVFVRVALAVGILVPLVGLWPELLHLTPDVNDGAFHLGVTRNTIAAIREGLNPLDFWVPTWLSGFPLFHYYQPAPYLLMAALHFVSGGAIPLLLLHRAVTIVALALFPLTNYAALRWLQQPRETAACAALLSWLISAHGGYGIELESFTWSGWGLFTQAVALPLLPLALAAGYQAIHRQRRTLGSAALVAATLLAHVLYGYIAAISLVLVPFMVFGSDDMRRRAIGLGRFGAQIFALTTFFVVPLVRDGAYHAKSLYDAAEKFDSHGARVILGWLFSGALFDYHRLPVLTGLIAVGLYFATRDWLERRDDVHGWFACGFMLWLALYFGRATWGALVDLLPLSRGLHMERLSSGVDLFALWLAAIALGRLVRWCIDGWSPATQSAVAIGIIALLAPMFVERTRYLTQNARNVALAQQRFEREAPGFEPILRELRSHPGRVYAGRSGNWGSKYKVGDVQVYHLLSAAAIAQLANAPFSWALSTDFQMQLDWPDRATYELYDTDYVLTDQPQHVQPGSRLLVLSSRHYLFRLDSEGPFGIVSTPLKIVGSSDTTWYATATWARSNWPAVRALAQLEFIPDGAGSIRTIRMLDPFRYVTEGSDEPHNIFDTPSVFADEPPPAPRGVLRDAMVSRQNAQVTAEMEEPGVVVFKATYHPAWRAFVDGIATPTLVLTPGLIGVHVPAGRHSLRLAYQPGWLKVGLLLSGVLIALALDRWWAVRGRADGGGAA